MTFGLDFLATLQPESGIARSVSLARPDDDRNPLWVLAVDIGQGDLEGRKQLGDDFSLSLVGAADVRRSGVYARAAGEAVERWALKPHPGLPPVTSPVSAPGGANWRVDACRSSRPTYAGILHREDGTLAEVTVPAETVDYPVDGAIGDDVDPSPSGTSAGAGVDDAVERACKEVLERDAAMRAWLSDIPLSPLDAAAVASAEPDFVRLREACARLSLRWAVAPLPTRGTTARGATAEGTTAHGATTRTVMAVVVDERHGVACAGLGLSRSETASATRALQEALQVRTVLTADDPARRRPAPDVVTDDAERARFWASPLGVAAGSSWLSSLSGAPERPRTAEVEPRWSSLVGDRIVVDLTSRLPDVVQRMGWAVVKVLPVTAQPLRMSEAPTWNVLPDLEVRRRAPHPFV